jgi:cell wall-associated NlpC family hydrolase
LFSSQMQPGDLVFYAYNTADPATIHHVGIYIGAGNMIDARDVSPAEWSSGCESPTVQNAGRGGLDHDEATPAHPGADRPQAP